MNHNLHIYSDFDFNKLNSSDFKEDSVREILILPLLKELGYQEASIERSKTLKDPILRLGSNKKIPIKYFPDYCLKVENNYAWVLDAKAPSESVISHDNIEQVYCYAYHKEIRSTYFALCNGISFALFRTQSPEEPVFLINLDEIGYHFERLKILLSPDSFQVGKNITYETTNAIKKPSGQFDYLNRPLLEEIPSKKQQAKRHFGVHGYFTKQSWNVVAEYIKNFTRPDDLVLDPFGGSGITAVEALMNNRKAINVDINPLAVFMVKALIAPVKESELSDAFYRVKTEYLNNEPKTADEIDIALKKYQYPKNVPLPKSSDVTTVDQLFNKKQLAQLSLLKSIILKEKDENARLSLLLAFSSSLNKYNLTFHYTKSDGGGDSGAFRYYRYRLAPLPGEMPLIDIYETKYKKVVSAKKDIHYYINEKTINNIQVTKGAATDLSWIPKESKIGRASCRERV